MAVAMSMSLVVETAPGASAAPMGERDIASDTASDMGILGMPVERWLWALWGILVGAAALRGIVLAFGIRKLLARSAPAPEWLQAWMEDGIRTRLHPAQDAADTAVDIAAVAAVELDLDDWLAADPLITVRQAITIDE